MKIETGRIFRTNKPALVKLKARNLKKVTVSQYLVNLYSYFRKAHRINNIEDLYIDLKFHVKAIASSDKDFKSGETNLRGLFVTTGINVLPTVIVRSGKSHYAFYRGKEILGHTGNRANRNPNKKIFQQQKQLQMNDYLQNSILDNNSLNRKNIGNWNMLRRGDCKAAYR